MPSPDEIAAIDRFRDVLLRAFDAAGVARPGQRAPASRRDVGRRRRAATAATAVAAEPPAELPPARPIEELLAELDALVGLRRR